VVDTRTCNRCGLTKPDTDFARCKAWAKPRTRVCKKCKARENNQRYHAAMRDVPRRRYTPQLTAEEKREIERTGRMRCGRCGERKLLEEFHRRRTATSVTRVRICAACRNSQTAQWKARHRNKWWYCHTAYKCKRYGITVEQFIAMLETQDYCCAICGRPLKRKGAAIDHDHDTGQVRGIVHSYCNLVIGNAGEDVTVLNGAIRYLKRHKPDAASGKG